MRFLAAHFPANHIRLFALRQCGFSVGKDVYLAPGLILSTMNSDNSCMLIIEDRVSIGPGVSLILASDPNHSKLNRIFKPVRGKITLKEDAWLGAGVIILPDITIGTCSVIASGAVVTKDVPPFSLYAGIPAKFIKHISNPDVEN